MVIVFFGVIIRALSVIESFEFKAGLAFCKF